MVAVYAEKNIRRPMKLIIAGSRNFCNINLFLEVMMKTNLPIKKLITGGCASGPDSWAESWSRVRDVGFVKFIPDWNTHGKSAGPIRNMEMAKYGDYLYAFWDGNSKGTKNMIDCMNKLNKPYTIFLF